ncbi:SAP30-binding protein [Topomyia yanbarensis]|uniref:SAP30-binding protein n=1 Tax=Topomyia yanbarensis TaxID=2498891 RepID=UPI00273B9CAE|nr:SAP30-binding protein [Topomyia yanbarensis]
MSGKNSALASLTATYTDSENEDDPETANESFHSDESSSSQVRVRSRQQTPIRELSEASVSPPEGSAAVAKPVAPSSTEASRSNESSTSRQKALRLVSYFDDTVVSDDENTSPSRIREDAMDISEDETPAVESASPKKIDRAKLYGFSLPPESKGKCSIELQEKIATLYEKMRNSNMDTNKIIQERKEFRNPSIYEKLIQFCDINELGTNYSSDIFDPFQWGKDSYYEELAKSQKIEMEKVEKARKENAKTEIQIGVKKMDTDDSKKRKSKWDQPGVLGAAPGSIGTAGVLKPAGIITQTLTTTATGTKGTVISAFGSLPKKPKV